MVCTGNRNCRNLVDYYKKIWVTLQTYQIYVEAFLQILLIYDTCIVHNNVYMSESIFSLFERFWKINKIYKNYKRKMSKYHEKYILPKIQQSSRTF